MTSLILQFLGLALAVVAAGTFLAKFSDALGERLGLGRTLAGLLLMGIATSLPELAVDCSAVLIDAPDLAVGDILGSCLFNLLILAVLDMLYRTRGKLFSREAGAHGLSAVSCIVLTAIVLLFIQLGKAPETAGAVRLGRVGLGSVAITAAYLLLARLIFYDQKHQHAKAQAAGTGGGADGPAEMPMAAALGGYVLSAAVILVTGYFLAGTADRLAKASGLGATFVGTLFVALTTSLPEITTTRAAVRMGAFDLAVGNIFGSNSFNILILVAADLVYARPLLASVSPVHAVTATAVILVTGAALLGILFQAERRLWKVEYDAFIVASLALGAFALVYLLG
jgi:cation:H+ antiporter